MTQHLRLEIVAPGVRFKSGTRIEGTGTKEGGARNGSELGTEQDQGSVIQLFNDSVNNNMSDQQHKDICLIFIKKPSIYLFAIHAQLHYYSTFY